MARMIRNTAILAKIETTYGTDAVPTGAANALLVGNASFETTYNNVGRQIIRPFMGGAEELVGTRFVKASFEVELAGSGTAGTAPAWGPLLIGCAMAEVITAATNVVYSPVSALFKSLTIYYYLDGLQKKMTGCMGNVSLDFPEGEIPKLKFEFTGIDSGQTAVVTPVQTLTSFKVPQVITNGNTGDVKFGGTYAAGAITGGTAYISRGISLSLGNSINPVNMLNAQAVDVVSREATGSCQLELTSADEILFRDAIHANTLSTLSFEHGTAAGSKVLVYAPAAQRINPKVTDYDGRVNLSLDLRLTPTSVGNNELIIVAK